MNADLLSQFYELIGINLPAMIVICVCLITTLTQWRRHPPAARWAFFAFSWLLFTYFLAMGWHAFGFHLFLENAPDAREMQIFTLRCLSCLEGLTYLFFLFALNAARRPYRPPEFYDHFADDDDRPRIH